MSPPENGSPPPPPLPPTPPQSSTLSGYKQQHTNGGANGSTAATPSAAAASSEGVGEAEELVEVGCDLEATGMPSLVRAVVSAGNGSNGSATTNSNGRSPSTPLLPGFGGSTVAPPPATGTAGPLGEQGMVATEGGYEVVGGGGGGSNCTGQGVA